MRSWQALRLRSVGRTMLWLRGLWSLKLLGRCFHFWRIIRWLLRCRTGILKLDKSGQLLVVFFE